MNFKGKVDEVTLLLYSDYDWLLSASDFYKETGLKKNLMCISCLNIFFHTTFNTIVVKPVPTVTRAVFTVQQCSYTMTYSCGKHCTLST